MRVRQRRTCEFVQEVHTPNAGACEIGGVSLRNPIIAAHNYATEAASGAVGFLLMSPSNNIHHYGAWWSGAVASVLTSATSTKRWDQLYM